MEHADLLRHLAELLDRLQLRYLVTGSSATIVYGESRFTNDIDVVVELPAACIDGLIAGFPESDFYVSRAAVASAVARKRQFNVIHPASGLKIDLIVASNSEFDRTRLDRARRLPVLPSCAVSFASPEDVILKKLQYFREGGSDKHLRDIAGVLKIQGDSIDRRYIADWAARMRLADEWTLVSLRAEGGPSATYPGTT